MKTRIEIDTNTFVRFWLVLIGFALAILAIYSARTALIMLLVAFFLALALNTPVHFLASRLPGRSRSLATAVAYVLIVVTLVGIVFLAVPPIIQQTSKFIQTLPALSEQTTTQWEGIGSIIDEYHLQPQIDQAIASLQKEGSGWAANAGRNIISGAGSVISFAISSFFVLVLTFLMLVEGPTWLGRVWSLYNNQDTMKRHHKLAGQMYKVVTGYVVGQVTVATIGGICAGVAVFILSLFFDLPGNLALPTIAITVTLSLVPMFGATIAGLLVTLLLAINSIPAAIIYAVYFAVYQQIENNFISPVIQSRRLELSALTVLIAVTVGFALFGILGSLISIPIAGSIKVFLDDYLEQKRHAHQPTRSIARLVKAAKK
jgi:predicted PurR-regulated permease PerM